MSAAALASLLAAALAVLSLAGGRALPAADGSGRRVLVVAVLAGLAGAAAGGLALGALAAAAAPAAAVLLTRRAAGRRERRRRLAVEAALPDAIDLLAGVVEAGVPLDQAIAGVALHTPQPLRAELEGCVDRLARGGSRRAALASLGASGVPDLSRLGGVLASGDELGAPVGGLLREQAALTRELRCSRVRERAGTAAPKISLVVGFLLVPAGLLLMLGAQVLAMLDSGGI